MSEKDLRNVHVKLLGKHDSLKDLLKDLKDEDDAEKLSASVPATVEEEGKKADSKSNESQKQGKIKDCKWEKQKEGSCRFKLNCKFNHNFDKSEEGGENSTSKNDNRDTDMDECTTPVGNEEEGSDYLNRKLEIRKNIFCKYEKFEKGSCRHGEECHFSHVPLKQSKEEGDKDKDRTKKSEVPKMNARKMKLCLSEFNKEGGCDKAKCNFSHKINDEMRNNKELVEQMSSIEEEISGKKGTKTPGEEKTAGDQSKKTDEKESEHDIMESLNSLDPGVQNEKSFLLLIRCLIQGQQELKAQVKELMKTK